VGRKDGRIASNVTTKGKERVDWRGEEVNMGERKEEKKKRRKKKKVRAIIASIGLDSCFRRGGRGSRGRIQAKKRDEEYGKEEKRGCGRGVVRSTLWRFAPVLKGGGKEICEKASRKPH